MESVLALPAAFSPAAALNGAPDHSPVFARLCRHGLSPERCSTDAEEDLYFTSPFARSAPVPMRRVAPRPSKAAFDDFDDATVDLDDDLYDEQAEFNRASTPVGAYCAQCSRFVFCSLANHILQDHSPHLRCPEPSCNKRFTRHSDLLQHFSGH